jgi:hypothetical protein
MAAKNEYDLLETTVDTGVEINLDAGAELTAVLDDLEALLKNGEVIGGLTAKGVNASLALVAIDGLRNYLAAKKSEAADDFATVADEIRGRLAATAKAAAAKGSDG